MAKHDLNVSSSDLARARALTASLAKSADEAAEAAPRAAVSGFVRFRSSAASVAAVTRPPSLPAPTFGGAAWDELIAWCISENPCDGGFLMDASGLVVTTRGDFQIKEIEALGAQLLVALDQTDRMSRGLAACSAISLRLGDICASGQRFSGAPGASLLLCLVGPEPATDAIRRACEEVVGGWYGDAPAPESPASESPSA